MKLLFCADNIFCDVLYPNHIISADEEPAGYEAYHVGTARRYPGDRWQATTANADHWVKVRADLLRAVDFVAIDRGSNQLGFRHLLQNSQDNFTLDIRTLYDLTIPTVPGGTFGTGPGVVTNEGVWMHTFTPELAVDWRFLSKAMGSGVIPQVVGLWAGKSWQPTGLVQFDQVDDEIIQPISQSTMSPLGWRSRSHTTRKRTGFLRIRLDTDLDVEMVRWQVMGIYAAGFPAWVCFDRETPGGSRKAMLISIPPDAPADFADRQSWLNKRMIMIPFEEEQQRLF